MKKELYLILLLFVLIPSGLVYAQVEGLQALANLLERPDADMGLEDEEEEEEEEDKESERAQLMLDFEDENYGYTGGKNFVNPPQGKFFEEPLSYFGYDFFINPGTKITSTKSLPIPPDYVLGPEDEVVIRLFGSTNSSWTLKISAEGEIFLPGIGPLLVTGLTFENFKQIIQEIVNNQMIGTTPSVTTGELRSIEIFVLGEAIQPGMYTVSSLSTLTNAIFESGGIKMTGSLRNIQLKRKGKVVSTFDFYDLLLQGDTSKDTRMMQGDVVFVPPITKTVGVAGEIGRPGIYELKEDETLGNLIQFAGNLKPKADLFSAALHRIDSSVNGFDLIAVDLNDFSRDSFELNNGDVLNVYPVVDNLKNVVLITGHAQQPGFFPWREGMRIGDLIKSTDNLLSMTDLTYVLLKRENKLNQSYQYLQVDLEEIFSNGASDSNILLLERDEIILLPSLLTPTQITTELIEDKYVAEDGQAVLAEDEWTSMTFLRKSLMDKTFKVGGAGPREMNPFTGMAMEGNISLEEQEVRRYYEYSIYHYCTIPEPLAISIIESGGFKPAQTVPFEDLEQLSTPADLEKLLEAIEKQQKTRDYATADDTALETTITDICRRQLLDPEIDILNRQRTSTKDATTVSVFGSVHFPGTYPLTSGMVLEDAIKAAGGMKTATYDSEIELSRSNNVGKRFSVAQSFISMANAQAMQTRLQEMDIITLKQMATNTGTVEITGEVFFAGTYPISENQTLGELVRRAGGITNHGSAEAAYFVRNSLQEAEQARLEGAKNELKRSILLSSQVGGLGQSGLGAAAITQLTTLLTDTDSTDALGRLVVDLGSILNGTIEDIILEDGDKLHIPLSQQTISIIGEVYMANSHVYEKNLAIGDYIELSGGTNTFADENNIYLIKVDGSIVSPSQLSGGFRRAASGNLQPGDTIVVPLEVQPFSGAKAATELTQIFYQMAIAAAAVNSF